MNKIKDSEEQLEIMRHGLAHILAMAVIKLFPDTKLGIGPAIENGFYYEFQNEHVFSPNDLINIENEMHLIIAENLEFKQIFTTREEAIDILHQSGQIFKTELLKQVSDDQISFFKTGNFLDLCRGPHVKSTKKIGVFKLSKVEPTFWLNQEHRPELQKISGIAFQDEESLNSYINTLHELRFKSAKIIGKNLSFLIYNKDFSDRNFIWLPKGHLLKEQVRQFLSAVFKQNNYFFVETPAIAKFVFFNEYFQEEAIKTNYLNPVKVEQEDYLIRTNCTPAHNFIFHSKKYSYRQLPIKLCEFGNCYKNNNNNIQYQTLESHIYCTKEQIVAEIKKSIQLTISIFNKFGFENIIIEAKTPTKDNATNYDIVKDAVNYTQNSLSELKLLAKISQNSYCKVGVELNFSVKDIFNKVHIISTIIIDLKSSIKEKLVYINKQNKPENCILIKYSPINSLDKFVSLLIEKFEGAFPLWLAPAQIIVLPISEKYLKEAKATFNALRKEGFRVEIDNSNTTIQSKIRYFEKEKIPYALIIGGKEIKTNSVSVRGRDGKELGLVRIEEFISKINAEIA